MNFLRLCVTLCIFIPTLAQATTCTRTFFTELRFERFATTLRKEEMAKLDALYEQLTHPDINLEVVVISAQVKASTSPTEAEVQSERVGSLKRVLLSYGLPESKVYAGVSVETKGFEQDFDVIYGEAIGLNSRCMELMQGKL